VEGVQGQLRRRFSNGLGSESTHHLAGVNDCLDVAVPDVAHEFIEQLGRQAVNHDRLLGSKVEPKQTVEDPVLGEGLDETGNGVDNVFGSEIGLDGIRIGILVDQALEINRCLKHIHLAMTEDTVVEHGPVVDDVLYQIRDGFGDRLVQEAIDVFGRECVLGVDVLQCHHHEITGLVLHADRIHTIVAVLELDDGPHGVANRAVVLHVLVLHGLHQTALNVTGIGGLDCCINETLTSCLGVEEELGRHETVHETVLNEPTRLRTIIVASEVGKGAVLKGVLNTLALNLLLT